MASRFALPFADVGAGIKPSSGAQLHFYDTDTYNRRNTFTDAGEGTANANPVVANSLGVFPAIFISGTYRVVLEDANRVQAWEEDGIENPVSDDIAANTARIVTLEGQVESQYSGVIDGLITSNAADAEHDITISSGSAADSTKAKKLVLDASITKQIDAVWAAGNNAGGLFSGTVAADTTYHMFIIEKDSDGSIDAGFDTNINAANIPSGYTAYRRAGSVMTDSSSNIIPFYQKGDYFGLVDRSLDLNTVSPGTSGVSLALSVPIGVTVIADLLAQLTDTGTADVLITSLEETDSVPSATNTTVRVLSSGTNNNTKVQKLTNTSGQIRYRSSVATLAQLSIVTEGWFDSREI